MKKAYKFFKRDISWLSFNYRVLLEAKDTSLPLYERINFISIYSSNLEEFYKVRVAEHKAIADEIILVLSTEETVTNGMTVSEMQKASEMLAGYSNQKISAILRKMVDSGTIVKTVDKKKSYFSIATDE